MSRENRFIHFFIAFTKANEYTMDKNTCSVVGVRANGGIAKRSDVVLGKYDLLANDFNDFRA